jgi:hypothetical protein
MSRFALAVPALIVLVLVAALGPRNARAADAPVMKIQATAGDSLSAAETKEINQTLTDYLEALRKKDYVLAGSFIDRTTLLASSEATLHTIEPDSTKLDAARARVFGVSTRDSMAQRSTGEIFAAFMRYMDSTNPGTNGVLDKATIQVLAARRMKDTVHVAYQLTLPPMPGRTEPYTQVTAQQMKKIDGKWKILVTD